jgi:hypothetical protein
MEVSNGNNDEKDDDNSNGAGSQEALCTYHKNKEPLPSPPPSPPPTMGGYSGEGAIQFAMWEHY